MLGKIPRFMSQEELDKKVLYYFVRAMEAIKENDKKKADKASESLNQLSASTLNYAFFRLAMIQATHNTTLLYKDSPACVDYICEHLPVTLSRASSLLVSSNPSAALCLAEKINKKQDDGQDSHWFGTGMINNAGLVANAMAEHGHATPLAIILDVIINYDYMSNSNLSVSLDLLHPLLEMKNDPVIQSYVKENEKKLIGIIKTVPSYLAEFSGPEVMFDQAIELTNLGSVAFAKAVFQENHKALSSNLPIDFLLQAGNKIGCFFDNLINMSSHTFKNGYGQSHPYQGDHFKHFAHYFINSESNFIPFVSSSSKNASDKDYDFLIKLVALDQPAYLMGLKQAIEASGPEKEFRVHELINALKNIATGNEILAALAAQLPDNIIRQHKDLNRNRLHNDLGM
jgi:hypothetical protein